MSELPPTWLMALEAKKLEHDLRVREIRGLSAGLLEKAPSRSHPFWAFGEKLGELATELEQLAAERFTLKVNERQVELAVLAEREACAKLCDTRGHSVATESGRPYAGADLRQAAELIRARGVS